MSTHYRVKTVVITDEEISDWSTETYPRPAATQTGAVVGKQDVS